jgi:hypothetical protein
VADWVDDPSSDRDCNDVIHERPYLAVRSAITVHEGRKRTRTKFCFTRLNTFRDRSDKVSRLCKSEDSRMNEALEIATSLPDPMAMPTSPAASACRIPNQYAYIPTKEKGNNKLTGASLIPSPTTVFLKGTNYFHIDDSPMLGRPGFINHCR